MSTRQASIFTMLILIAVLMLSGAATAQVGASQTTDGTVHSLPDDHNQGEWVEFTHTLGPDPQTLHPVKMYSQNYSTLWGLEKNATAFGQGTASNYMFGDGSDGDLTVASGQTYYTDDTRSALAASASADQSNITLSNAVGFAVGHEVLVIQMQGTGAGNYEFGTIAAINGNTLTLQRKLTNAYTVGGNDKAQIIRVLQYRNVTVQSGGILTAHAWDGTTGGVICFRVSELFEVQSGGSINVIGIGFRGGLASTVNVDGYAFRGEGSNQLYNATKYYTNNLDAAGGGENEINSNIRQTGGGGGGYGTPGINGTKHNLGNGNVGQGGGVFGAPDLSIIFLGAGGGGGGSNWQQSPPPTAKGGNGGGIVMLFANDMVVYGAINATGSNGETVLSDTGDGGGGAGGSILIKTRTANLGSNNLTANGGLGGTGGPGAFGGNGGEGRIRFEYCDTFSGSTNPPASVAKINCYGTVAGKVFRDDNGNGAQDAGEPGLASVTVSLSGVGQTATGGDGPGRFHRVLGSLQHRARFNQKRAARFRQPNGLGAAFQQQETEFVLKVANLPA